jgi:hypothetical protein
MSPDFEGDQLDSNKHGVSQLPTQLFTYWPGRFIPFDGVMLSLEANRVVTPHHLCEKCNHIREWIEVTPIKSTKEELRFEHHTSGRQLELSANEGCHLCTLLWQGATDPASIYLNLRREEMWAKHMNDARMAEDLEVLVRIPSQVSGSRVTIGVQSKILRSSNRFPMLDHGRGIG